MAVAAVAETWVTVCNSASTLASRASAARGLRTRLAAEGALESAKGVRAGAQHGGARKHPAGHKAGLIEGVAQQEQRQPERNAARGVLPPVRAAEDLPVDDLACREMRTDQCPPSAECRPQHLIPRIYLMRWQ